MRAWRDPRTQVARGAEVQLLLRTAVGIPSGLAPSLWSRSFGCVCASRELALPYSETVSPVLQREFQFPVAL